MSEASSFLMIRPDPVRPVPSAAFVGRCVTNMAAGLGPRTMLPRNLRADLNGPDIGPRASVGVGRMQREMFLRSIPDPASGKSSNRRKCSVTFYLVVVENMEAQYRHNRL